MARRIDDLPAGKLRALLEADPNELTEPVSRAIRDFIERIGGRANAQLAVQMLEELERSGD